MRHHRLAAALLCSLAAGALLPFPRAIADTALGQRATADSAAGALSPATGSPQRQAAVDGLAALAAHLPASTPLARANRIFDVDDYRSLREARIGDGFETYLVDPPALLSGKRLDQALYGSGEWRFIVMENGKGVGLITVARMNGQWSMVEAGASELADEVASVAARYARQAPQARLRFIRSPQAVADFIEVSSISSSTTMPGGPIYIPLGSARALLARANREAAASESGLSETELGEALRPNVKRGSSDLKFTH